ncbi:TPA: hypothetical protein JG914_004494 [Enterobacter hormaechei subsp. steigerwaltii]|nr:hypothetical protein [Enterobacter hormaechei subsp. steigerwaltii]
MLRGEPFKANFIVVLSFFFIIVLLLPIGIEHIKKKNVDTAYVSYSEILKGTSILQQEKDKNEEAQNKFREKIVAQQKSDVLLPEPLRRENYLFYQAQFNNEMKMEATRNRMISLKVINNAIENYRVNHDYSLVLNKDTYTPTEKGVDISDDIIKELVAVRVDYGSHTYFIDDKALNK